MPPKTKRTYSTDWKSNKATKSAIEKFEEQFGKEMGAGVLTRSDKITPYEVVSTGSIALDSALGVGGLPCGRVAEIWGPEHAGKTTLAMLIVATAQRQYRDKMVAWVDMEQTFDKTWAKALGVDLKRLWLVENPKTAEDVADATKRFVESGLCSVVVLDSIGGMISKKEFEKEADEATVAAVAGIVTRMVKQVSPIGRSNGTLTVVINQVRANIGQHGASQHTSGGWALKHITTIKMKVSRGGSDPLTVTVDGKPLPVAYETAVRVEKNKCAPYGRVASIWIKNQATAKYGAVGIDTVDEAVQFGVREGVIAGKGTAWVTLPNGERFNGKEKAKAYLTEHPEMVTQIRDAVMEKLAEFHEEGAAPSGESEDPMEAYLAEQDAKAKASA